MKVEKQWTDIIWRMSGGSAVEYKALMAMDVNEFFNAMKSNRKHG